MYVGHLATGILIKALCPDVSTNGIIFGVAWLDLLHGVFVLLGVEKVRPNILAGPYLYFDLVFIDWCHSLTMAVLLSLLWGTYFRRQGSKAAVVTAAASFSHWLCDLPMHNHDLAAYPYSEIHYGWAWWSRWLTKAWLVEGAFSAACIAIAGVTLAQRGQSIKQPAILCLVLFLNLSPWTSPMQWIAQLGHPYDYLGQGGMVLLGFSLPSWLLVRIMDKKVTRSTRKAM